MNETKDCGSTLHHITRLRCDIHDCRNIAKWQAYGHIHFKLDGSEYSMDRMMLCDGHHEPVKDIIHG